MTVKPYKEGYIIEDIFVYPQKVTAGNIEVDVSKYGMWKAGLTDEQDMYLCGQGHSHVNMMTIPSTVDMRHQHDGIKSKKNGYFLFQIWNKCHHVSSFFYDIDRKYFYPSSNIESVVEFGDEDSDLFLLDTFEKIEQQTFEEIQDEYMEDF